jgi:hypothetical protein
MLEEEVRRSRTQEHGRDLMHGRFARLATSAAVVATLAMMAPTAAHAGSEDVTRRGGCSGASDWKLKVGPEDGRLEVEFEVDQNRPGDRWRVRIRHDGELAFAGSRMTRPPSGSFELRIVEPNRGGADAFRARATNLRTGETCIGAVSF